jgi:hypothetical protein
MVITESGDFHTVPEYRCSMSKNYSSACNLLKEELSGISTMVAENGKIGGDEV